MLTTSSKKFEAVIAEKDAQIALLQSELSFLRSLVSTFLYTKPSMKNESVQIEANAIMNGSQEQIDLNELSPESIAIANEREQLLSGNY